MSGDVVARARRLTAGVDSGQWDVVREQGEFYGVYQGEFGRRVAGLIYDRREAEFIAATRTLVPELIEELEMQTSLQGLSVQIPEYGEWGSETLLCLFQDFGIQPGDGYQAASARQGDLLRSLAAANAEVEKLRGALETVRTNASCAVDNPVCAQHNGHGYWIVLRDILSVIERAGIEP